MLCNVYGNLKSFLMLFMFFCAIIMGNQQVFSQDIEDYEFSTFANKEKIDEYGCGPVGLYVICRILDVNCTLSDIAIKSEQEVDGKTYLDKLLKCAHSYNIDAEIKYLSVKDLKSMSEPILAYVDGNHFLVLLGPEKDGAIATFDLRGGLRSMSINELKHRWKFIGMVCGNISKHNYNALNISFIICVIIVLLISLILFYRRYYSKQIYNISVCILIFSLFYLFAGGCVKKEDYLASGPSIELDNVQIDMGDVSSAAPYYWQTQFHNNGSEDLVIERIDVDCSCTSVEAKPEVLSPGDTGVLSGKIETRKSLGRKKHIVKILTNIPNNEVKKVEVEANVVDDVIVSPREIYVGDIQGKWTGNICVTLRDSNWYVTDINTPMEGISAKIIKEDILPEDRGREVTIGINIDSLKMLPSTLKSEIVLLTNIEMCSQIVVPIVGRTWGSIMTNPALVSFGNIGTEETCSRTVRIYTLKNKKLKIQNAKIAQLNELNSNEYELDITFSPQGKIGIIREEVKLYLEGEEDNILKLPVIAYVSDE